MNLSLTKQIIIGLSILAIWLILFVQSAFASVNYASGQQVVLPASQTVNSDYFAAGNTVLINGTVNGDAYVAGGTIRINGTINGDLIAVGGTISIPGHVTGNIRTAGGEIAIIGKTDKNITVAGGNITIDTPAKISGSVVGAGGNMVFYTPIGKGLTIAGGKVTISNTVGGDVTVQVGQLTLMPSASVSGSLNYWSSQKADIAKGATIAGSTTFHHTNWEQQQQHARQGIMAFYTGFSLFWTFFSFVTSLIIGIFFLLFLPEFTQDIVEVITTSPWKTLGIGLLALILLPTIVMLLVISILGIPLAIILIAGMFIFLCINEALICITIGQKLLPQKSITGLIVGLVIYQSIGLIPVINWFVGFVALCFGFGAILSVKKHLYIYLRSEKII